MAVYLVLELDICKVVKHPASSSAKMSVGASEFWENDADEKLLKLIFVVLLLQKNVGHRAYHVQGAVLLRGSCVRVLK
jgi:hypothetical protein